MSPELVYFLKINIALVLFYAFYWLVYRKDTFFLSRRFLLLSFTVVAISFPFFDLKELVKEYQPVSQAVNYYTVLLPEILIESGKVSANQWIDVLFNALVAVYLGGVLFFGARFLIQLGSLLLLAYRSQVTYIQGIRVHLLKEASGPFSFFRLIFIHPQSHSEEEIYEILTHEQTHGAQYHTLDVILSELLTVFCWVNPFAWLLKREVRQNLEYLADRTVLSTGHDRKTYQYHLLGLANQKAAANLYTNFNVLSLKNRIIMMNKKRSRDIGRTKYLLFVPFAAAFILVSNMDAVTKVSTQPIKPVLEDLVVVGYAPTDQVKKEPVVQSKKEPVQKKTAEQGKDKKLGKPNGENSTIFYQTLQTDKKKLKKLNGELVYEMAEVMPEFPGGVNALMTYLSQTIKYPVKAAEKAQQGTVVVSFVVDKKGKVEVPEVLRSAFPSLDAEALRVVSSMPTWTPGKDKGKIVQVRYTLPIKFKLQ